LRKHRLDIADQYQASRDKEVLAERKSLREICKLSVADGFLDELIAWLDEPPGLDPGVKRKPGFKGQSALGRPLWVLFALNLSVTVSGLRHFLLTWEIGEYFLDASAWARMMQADTTARYLEEATELLPRMPRKDAARVRFVDALPGDVVRRLAGIDRKYRGRVTRELPAKIRRQACKDVDALEASVGRNGFKNAGRSR
jgi:hypothetical protein